MGATAMNPPGEVKVWDVSTGLCTLDFTVKGHAGAVAFSPDGATLAVSQWGTLGFWDLSSGKSLGETWVSRAKITCLAYSPNGSVLAAGSEDGWVRMVKPPRRKKN